MNWIAAIEQRQDALMRVFFMLVAMTLLNVRALLDLQPGSAETDPVDRVGQKAEPQPSQDLLLGPLRAAEQAARRLVILMMQELYEILTQRPSVAHRTQAGTIQLGDVPRAYRHYLDTS